MLAPITQTAPSPALRQKRELAAALMAKAKQQRKRRPKARRGKKPQDLLSWVCLRRRELRPGENFDLPKHLYLVEMFQNVAREIVYMKAGQIGVSELLISYAFHACDERGADVLYMMPTASDVTDFSQSRFGPALEASPYLASIVLGASRTRRGGADKVTLKRIRDSFLYLRGGTVGSDGRARQLKSVPVDILIADELDEMDDRAVPIGRKRLGHSPIKEVRQASTPSYTGIGIHSAWLASDQREWFVPCPHCGQWQQLLIDNVVLEFDDLGRPLAWHGQEDDTAWVACEKCGKQMDRLAPGEWVPTFPDRRVIGYHPTKLMAGHTPLITVVRNLNTVDETSRKEAFNQDLGLPYTPQGGRLTEADLDECRREYAHGPVAGAGASMGVDVNKLLTVVIRAKPDGNGDRKQLYAGQVLTFDEVGRLMRQYDVATCVIDNMPETRSARNFQAEFPDKQVWLCNYVEGQSGAKKASAAQWDARYGNVTADRTWTLDITFSRFYDRSNILPANIRGVPDYYKHMVAAVRVIEDKKGGTSIARYVHSGRDDFVHAENYCTIAAMRPVGWSR